jgi:epoxyqueuosine reductase
MADKECIKSLFAELGADLCGIAGIDRFIDAPAGFHPKDAYGDCKAVIVFGKKMPSACMLINPRLIYLTAMGECLRELDRIAFMASSALEKYGGMAIPLPSDSPYEFWNEDKAEGRGLISIKHAAELAGLGRLGKNTLLINREFGNLLMLGAVLTNLELSSDPIETEELCIHNCRLCIENCPQKALNGITIDQKRCRALIYGVNGKGFGVCNCNRCRTICPRAFGNRRAAGAVPAQGQFSKITDFYLPPNSAELSP